MTEKLRTRSKQYKTVYMEDNKQITRELLVEKCAATALTAIVNGNLKQAIGSIIDEAINWSKGQVGSSEEVLLNEVKDNTSTKIEDNTPVSTPQSEPVVRPAPVGNTTSSITQGNHGGPKPAPVGNKVSTGWSNPFQGTSWGV